MPGAELAAKDADPHEKHAGARSLVTGDNMCPGAEEGCLILSGEIRTDFQEEVTPKGVPEPSITWVRAGGGQGIQGKLRTHKKGILHPSPLLSTSSPPLIPMATLRDKWQHFKDKETSLEKSGKFSRPTQSGRDRVRTNTWARCTSR